MAAPSYVSAATGATDAGGVWAFTVQSGGGAAGAVWIIQILQDGATSGAVALTGQSGATTNLLNLAGSVGLDYLGEFPVGASSEALQHLWICRQQSIGGTCVVSGTNSTSEDLYFRAYQFSNVSTGTTLATVIENSTAGNTANGTGTSGTIADTGVTTLGPDRLALNFVGLNDDTGGGTLAAFTGMTGGTWAEAVAEYTETSGTDGTLQLQTATITSAGTINGGTTSNPAAVQGWGVVGFALIGTTPSGPTYQPRDAETFHDFR